MGRHRHGGTRRRRCQRGSTAVGLDPYLILTLPGVGLTLAVVIALEVGEVTRFASAEKLAAYAGTTPRGHATSSGRSSKPRTRSVCTAGAAWSMACRAGALQNATARGPATSVSPESDRTGCGNPIPTLTRVAHVTLRISKIPAHGAALSDMGPPTESNTCSTLRAGNSPKTSLLHSSCRVACAGTPRTALRGRRGLPARLGAAR
jgi:Transposase IS116/IS110/IS902 family